MLKDPEQDGGGAEELERLFARVLVAGGGAFWAVAAFAGPYVFGHTDLAGSVRTAMWPFLAAVVTLGIGWTYERLAAVLLFAACAATVVWGVLYGWEPGAWMLMAVVLIGPMATAGLLFVLASRAEQRRSS